MNVTSHSYMIRTEMDALAATLARILIGGFFALSGANNLLDIGSATTRAVEAGLPAGPIAIFIIACFKLIAGMLIMIKHHTKIASFFLIIYITLSSLIFYNPLVWGVYPDTEAIFMRNLAILGGLLFLYAHSRNLYLMRPQERVRMGERDSSPSE